MPGIVVARVVEAIRIDGSTSQDCDRLRRWFVSIFVYLACSIYPFAVIPDKGVSFHITDHIIIMRIADIGVGENAKRGFVVSFCRSDEGVLWNINTPDDYSKYLFASK